MIGPLTCALPRVVQVIRRHVPSIPRTNPAENTFRPCSRGVRLPPNLNQPVSLFCDEAFDSSP